mmetsp:Transcript_89084/g.252574  ORF Transcript_89084/g.252574 Transcript_89084/m.252574 type:complete len:237 (+) Transcript_89084:879-1589(+)
MTRTWRSCTRKYRPPMSRTSDRASANAPPHCAPRGSRRPPLMIDLPWTSSPKEYALITSLSGLRIRLVTGLTTAFKGEWTSTSGLAPPSSWLAIHPAARKIGPPRPVIAPTTSSSGISTATESMLNMSWTVAPAKARSSSARSPICPMETMVLVTEVPMFAPMMTGTASWELSCPAATRPTTMEVLVEEDCTSTVPRMPIMSPTTGFGMCPNSAPASFPPSTLKASAIRDSPTMKK